MSYGRNRRESHEKHMGSYIKFAWKDAMAMAGYIEDEIGATKCRKLYESITLESLIKFESSNSDSLAEFIQKSESHRPAYLRRFLKGVKKENEELNEVAFLVLALIGCLRAKDVLDIRDNYRYVLAPGSGNRITTAGVYSFAAEVKEVFNYDWPEEVFDAIGICTFDDDEDEDDDEIW